MYFCYCKAEFSAAINYSSLQCHMILQKSFLYADLLLKKHFLILKVLKTIVLLNIFGKIMVHFCENPLMKRMFDQ